jgi:hypothetical protein
VPISTFCFPCFCFVDHGCHDGDWFTGFGFDGQGFIDSDLTFLMEEFEPEGGFVSFLKSSAEFGNEFCITARPRRCTDMSRNREVSERGICRLQILTSSRSFGSATR